MMILVALLFLSVILGLAGCFWALDCNERAYSQRAYLIRRISEAAFASKFEADYWPAFDSVSYERHVWLLATFRDPWAEYVGLPPGFPKESA